MYSAPLPSGPYGRYSHVLIDTRITLPVSPQHIAFLLAIECAGICLFRCKLYVKMIIMSRSKSSTGLRLNSPSVHMIRRLADFILNNDTIDIRLCLFSLATFS